MTSEATDSRARHLISRSRARAALMQAEVAERAGIPQSTVSAYEFGRRQPTLPMLSKLLEAMGWELTIEAAPLPARLRPVNGPVGLRVRRHRRLIVELARRRGALSPRVFGALAQGTEQPDARVELLVDATPEGRLMDLLNLQIDLEDRLGVRVWIVAEDRLSPADHAEADRTAVRL